MHLRHHLWCKGKKEMEQTRRTRLEWSVWSTAHVSMFNPPSGRFTLLLSALGHLKFPLLRCFTTPPPSHSHALSSCHCYLTATRHSVDPAVLHTSTRDIPLCLGSHLLDVAMRWRAVNSGRGKLFAPLSHLPPLSSCRQKSTRHTLVRLSRPIYVVIYSHWSFHHRYFSLVCPL